MAKSKARKHVDHEGAKEATAPGAPAERAVITPDWAHLDRNEPSQCVPGDETKSDSPAPDPSGTTEPSSRVKGPAIDRHR